MPLPPPPQYGEQSTGGVSHVPPGWDWWVGLVGNSRYYNYTLSVNGTARRHGDDYAEDYLTDVIVSDRWPRPDIIVHCCHTMSPLIDCRNQLTHATVLRSQRYRYSARRSLVM